MEMLLDNRKPNLGKCCICETEEGVHNVMMMHFKAPPVPDGEVAGWGCIQCGLPCEGAIAVLCNKCFDLLRDEKVKIRLIVVGYPYRNNRIPIDQVEQIPFEHDLSKHY